MIKIISHLIKLKIDYSDEFDNLNRIINQSKNKVFIFEDTNYCEGEIDGELGKLSLFRMTVNKISLDDKIMYCKKALDEYNIKYPRQELKEYADVPFWILKNIIASSIRMKRWNPTRRRKCSCTRTAWLMGK